MFTDKLGRTYVTHGRPSTPLTPEQRIISRFKQTTWNGLNARTVNGSHPGKDKAKRKYLERGIRLEMTKPEFYFWCDSQSELILKLKANNERPSLDRIKDDGHYTIDNIRILSLGDNSRLGSIKGRAKSIEASSRPVIVVNQRTHECIWYSSAAEASRGTGISKATIWRWCSGRGRWNREANVAYRFVYAP